MTQLVKLLVLVGLIALVASDFPLEENVERVNVADGDNELAYRVPEDLDPIHFEVEITPYFEDAPAGKQNFTFDGKVKINMRAIKDTISSIYIQENVREIDTVTLTTVAVPPLQPVVVELDPSLPFERIREFHFLKINLANNATLINGQEYLLTIEYVGNINETPLQRGVFRGSYKDENGTHWYAATHLQPVNSRQAFPCFDEPGFKSTFDIIINRPAHFGETYSNMPIKETIPMGDRDKEIFHRTPRMSAYLVTFHISEAFTVIADNEDPARSYRILARPTARGQGEYALEVGPPLTKWLEEYLGIDYYTMAENMKNDQIASPYWASGATENWGLVTYRELRLLYEEGETNAVDKMSIATITAHELAHKWFGNLITARWWDNVWVNEGFASYFEYFAMDGVDESMELADQFNIMYVQSALSADSSVNTRALQHEVNSPAEVTGHFSGISYSKGASLLLMTKHVFGEPVFQAGLNHFLTNRSYEHAFPEHLYEAFAKAVVEENSEANTNVITHFLRSWVEEPGYPVINVRPLMTFLDVTQERFFIDPSVNTTDQLYSVPLTYATSSDPDFENLNKTSAIMWTRSHSISTFPSFPENDWIVFNLQQKGLYRVNYSPELWQNLATQLENNFTVIHHLNRAQIVDDVFALMRSERLSYNLGFKVINFLKKDTSYYSWYPAISGFSWLRNRFLHLPDILAEFDKIILEFMDAVIEDLGYDVVPQEPLTRTLNRFYVLSFACNSVGHQGCIDNALAKFDSLRNNQVSVNPNLRRHVFCQGVLAGGYEEWSFLNNRRKASNNQADEVAMLRSLGCTTNDVARQEYLNMILDDDEVKAQDRLNAFSFLMMGHRSNANVVLQFFKQNINEIRQAFPLPAWFNSLISNLASYLDEEGLDDMEAWLNQNMNTFPEYALGISSINSARANQAWGTAKAEIVLTAARGSAVTILPTTMLLLTTCLALLLR